MIRSQGDRNWESGGREQERVGGGGGGGRLGGVGQRKS